MNALSFRPTGNLTEDSRATVFARLSQNVIVLGGRTEAGAAPTTELRFHVGNSARVRVPSLACRCIAIGGVRFAC